MSASWCLSNALTLMSKLPESEREAFIAALPEACPRAGCTTGLGCRAYVASVAGSAVELRRRMCEARHYLRQGCTSGPRVQQLVETITARRGQAAAEQLRDDMRVQWARRREWMP
ncbi:DUF7696 family protein [Pseudoxanthomonas winnipegensis]|uniref:Uncharacterized protein n=1 Tax=Pseudoxanthomonas winnipegensis TaxID=2480810 RepID=A0A4Q8M7C5_9GAMM|nr:hypothetical protein [Pseudoxanthomonas winnipegensis]TAA45663.1 hypothetical protein EA655_05615 [Pseudoxanthomonas winnipegensis]